MKLTKIDIITIALAVIVPAAAYLGWFRRRLASLRQLSRQAVELEQRAEQGQQTATDAARARRNLRLMTDRIAQFMDRISEEKDAHQAVGAIVEDARQAGVSIEQLRPGEGVEGKTLHYLPVHLAASATFPNIYDFLRRIEQSRSVMTVNRMQVESKPRRDRCTVRLELRVYFVPPDPQTATGAQT